MIKKSKIWVFDPVIYPYKILVTKDFDEEELKESFGGDIDMTDDSMDVTDITDEFKSDGWTTARMVSVVNKSTMNKYMMVIMFTPKNIGAGICAHESLHLANAYLQHLGFSPCRAYDDEQYAYFLQWVTNCMWSVLTDAPQIMKGKLLR